MKKILLLVLIIVSVSMNNSIEASTDISKLVEAYDYSYAEEQASKRMWMDSHSYSILLRIVEAEATGGTIEQKQNVASCVLARYWSKGWPDTIEGVVFQKHQFSPIDDGRYWKVTVTDSTREAVWLTLKEGCTHDCFYFCTHYCNSYKTGWFSTLDEQFYDGMHGYFKE